ncbi:MAG: hypothetical protein GY765_43895 [bacterium]|nr:hypothetical protein [bacterium]
MKKISVILLMVFVLGILGFAGDKEEKVTVKPYGFIKLDAVYETGKASHGNFAIWATNPGDSDGLFHATANQTRLGFNIKGIGFGKFKVSGKLEVDFYGGGAGGAENKAYNYMRHAFLKISNGTFSLIAGQTWDIINPLNPATLNYPVLWGAGNMGYRRPQLSVRQDFKTGKNMFSIQAGIFRTIASDFDGDGIKDGVASGMPSFQGRISGKFALGEKSSLQLGVSGHYGKSKGIMEFTSDSINVDLLLVLSPKFKIIGEFVTGKNLGTFLGGIAQSIGGMGVEVETKAFYVNAVGALSKKLTLSVGFGMDDPDDAQLTIGQRAKNTTFFANMVYKFSKSLKAGFEVSNWETEYDSMDKEKTLRLQHSWILSF